MNNYGIQVIEDFNEFLSLEREWDTLVLSMDNPLPFLTHSWIRLWWASFGGSNGLYIITVRDNQKLVGILPLQRTTCKVVRIFRLPCLHSLTNGHAVMFNVICRLSELGDVLRIIKTHLENNSRLWSVVVLGYIPSDFGTVDALTNLWKGDDWVLFSEPRDGAFYIDIDGEFRDYYESVNKSFRDNRKNIFNRMSRLGKVEFEVLKTYDPESVEHFYNLENTGWKSERGSAIRVSNELVKFYNGVARTFSEKKQFLLATLRIGSKPVSSIFGLLFEGVFYFLKIGANYSEPVYQKLSPGQSVLHRLIEYCFSEKIQRFDFYGPCYSYEAHWTKKVNRRYTLMIFNRRGAKVKICIMFKSIMLFLKNLKPTKTANK